MSPVPLKSRFTVRSALMLLVALLIIIGTAAFVALALAAPPANASLTKASAPASAPRVTQTPQPSIPAATFASLAHPHFNVPTVHVALPTAPLSPAMSHVAKFHPTIAAYSHPTFAIKTRKSAVQEPVVSPKVKYDVPLVKPEFAATVAVQAALKLAADGNHPYVWGQAGPSAFDCSGLIVWVYGRAGIALPHFTGSMVRLGTRIGSLGSARPGDLVFFNTTFDHMGLYIGNGNMVVAAHSGTVIKIERVYETPSVIVRIT